MLSEVMAFYGLRRTFRGVGYFETEHHRKLIEDLKAAIQQGQLVADPKNPVIGKEQLPEELVAASQRLSCSRIWSWAFLPIASRGGCYRAVIRQCDFVITECEQAGNS
jgi:hypothetical protein